jgi:hypothetical protein
MTVGAQRQLLVSASGDMVTQTPSGGQVMPRSQGYRSLLIRQDDLDLIDR